MDNKWAELCKLKVKAFDDDGWLWQRKYDGCRMKVDIVEGAISLTARSGADKTAQFPDVVQALALTADYDKMPMTLDAELISAQGLGFQEFNQRRMNRTEDIALLANELPAKLVAFDVLQAYGRDHTHLPLRSRLSVLRHVVPPWCMLPEESTSGTALWMTAEANRWEGIVGKNLDERYFPNKRAWVKVKRWVYAVFNVVAVVPGMGKRAGLIGAYVLADDTGRLVGECGNFKGVRYPELAGMTAALRKTREYNKDWPKGAYGVLPFRIQVKFQEYTNDNMLRFPVYVGPEHPQERHGENPGTSG